MKYAVITVDKDTKRIIKSELYKEPGIGEIEVDSLPNGDISDYLYEDGNFVYSPAEPKDPSELDSLREQKISQTKTALKDFLVDNPLKWTDGKYYSVTSEKQSLLTSNLALYQVSASAGIPFKLTWNSTGEECAEWSYESLCALALAIGTYVKPFVAKQQELEIQINGCKTKKEIEDIEIEY